MAGRGKRFLQGFARTGSKATKRLVEGLIYWDEMEKQRKAEERQARQDTQNERYINARIAEMQEPKEEKPFRREDLLRTDPEQYYKIFEREEQIKSKYKEPKEAKRPEDVTGIGEVIPLVRNRQKEREQEIEDWNGQFEKATGGLSWNTYIELQRDSDITKTLSEKMAAIGFDDKGVPLNNQQISMMFESIHKLPSRPEPYKPPRGDAFRALSDSVEVGRTNPAVAAELLGVQGTGVGTRPVTAPTQAPADNRAATIATLKVKHPDWTDEEITLAMEQLGF